MPRSEKERRLLGIEEGYEEVALQGTRGELLGNGEIEGDRGGIVVDARGIDDAVVVGAEEEGRKRPVFPANDSNQVGELLGLSWR